MLLATNELYSIIRIGRGSKRILFAHGLFSNPAFWINYLGKFTGFELLLLKINYEALADCGDLCCFFDLLNADDRLGTEFSISHSFGSVLLNGCDNIKKKFFIATPTCSMGYERANLIRLLDASGVNYNPKIIDFAEKIVADFAPSLDGNTVSCFPDADGVFSPSNINEHICFKGSHFEISNAIEYIRTQLC